MKHTTTRTNSAEKKIEDLFSSISTSPREGFSQELEQRILTLKPKKNSIFKSPWRFIIPSTVFAICALFFVVQADFASASLDRLVDFTRKILFPQHSFELTGVDGSSIEVTYISFDTGHETMEADKVSERYVQIHHKALEQFIALVSDSPEKIGKLLVKGFENLDTLYVVALDTKGQPIRVGVIGDKSHYLGEYTMEVESKIAEILCEKLESTAATFEENEKMYKYSNLSWGLQYMVPNRLNLEADHLCGGGGSEGHETIEATTQFTSPVEFPGGFVQMSVRFLDGSPDSSPTPKKEVYASREWYVEDVFTGDAGHIAKQYSFRAHGLVYILKFDTREKDTPKMLAIIKDILDSVVLSEPAVINRYTDEKVFLNAFQESTIYDYIDGNWKNRLIGEIPNSETDYSPEFSDTRIELPISFIFPTIEKNITQYYTERHLGIDVEGKKGSNILAAAAGIVEIASCDWNGGYGCMVVIDHGDSIKTVYAHADTLSVVVGDQVTQGQVIAKIGATGRAAGSHLHFELRIHDKIVNPILYIQ